MGQRAKVIRNAGYTPPAPFEISPDAWLRFETTLGYPLSDDMEAAILAACDRYREECAFRTASPRVRDAIEDIDAWLGPLDTLLSLWWERNHSKPRSISGAIDLEQYNRNVWDVVKRAQLQFRPYEPVLSESEQVHSGLQRINSAMQTLKDMADGLRITKEDLISGSEPHVASDEDPYDDFLRQLRNVFEEHGVPASVRKDTATYGVSPFVGFVIEISNELGVRSRNSHDAWSAAVYRALRDK